MTLRQHFNQATIEAPATFSIAVAEDTHPLADEQGVVRGLKVFRTGRFPDSRGRIKTWTVEDLNAMVANFSALIADGSFPNVPVRADHTLSVKDVVGYYQRIYVSEAADAKGIHYLLADVELCDPSAREKWNTKTWRSRSIEIGAYPTNDGKIIRPTVMGLAFVDIPAVEGLYRHPAAPAGTDPDDQSSGSGTTPNKETNGMAGETQFKFRLKTGEESDPAAIQAYITGLEAQVAAGPQKFRIAGVETDDFAKVQAHIDQLATEVGTLREFKDETIKHGRTSFIDKLVAGNKITAGQAETFKGLALSMTAEQFGKFQEGFATAPGDNLFGKHPAGGGNGQDDSDAAKARQQEIADLNDIVSNFRLNEVPEDEIKNTKAYKRLTFLTEGKG